MSFPQRLQNAAEQVDARLHELLQENNAVPGAELPDSPAQVHPRPARLAQAIRHGTFGGGKRLRPFLVIECAALCGFPAQRAVNAAAAIECVHCYSLIHDDLPSMDDDELRRGQPSVWHAYDEWTAILAGDGLLTLAFETLAQPLTHPDAGVRSALVLALARASGTGGMVGGQALDLDAAKRGEPTTPDQAHVAQLQAMKTGALITCACEMGAILAGAPTSERDALRRYGTALGAAYQIADDLIDAEGDAATAGKAVAKDAAAGKATLVGLLGVERARQKLRLLQDQAIAALTPCKGDSRVLQDAARFVGDRRG